MSGTEIPTRRPHKRRKETISNDRLVTALNAALIESTICVPPIAVNVWQGLDSPTDKEVEGLTRKGRRASSDLFDDFMEPRPNALGVCDAISWALYTDTTFTHFIENGIRPPGCTASLSSPTWTFYAWLATLQRSLTPFELTEWYAETFGPLIEVMEDVLKKDTSSSGPDSDDAAEDAERPAKRQKTSSETKCTKVWQFLDEMRTLQMKTSGPSPPSSSAALPSTTRVKYAVAAIDKRTPVSSFSRHPTSESPLRKMPGAWPRTPPRQSAGRKSDFIRFRRAVSDPIPRHFCPLLRNEPPTPSTILEFKTLALPN